MTAFAIPLAHRQDDTSRAAAIEMLGGADALDALVRGGLPVGPDDRFDSHDLFNFALRSGGGRTVPEQAFAFALRWMRSPAEALLEPRTSRFSLSLTCSCDPVTLARPHAEPYGGSVSDVTAATRELTATVRTVGSLVPLRSEILRDEVEAFANLGVRWVKLPDALREDVDLVTAHRVATCESASLYLARRFRDAGYLADTRIGWVLGMLDLVHAWVEVVDDDGVTKVVDPVFALLADLVPGANPLLTDPAVALRTNRLVPTDLTVGGRVAGHACGATPRTKITPVKETP
ncbi:hypothetical protein [Saccharothrix variisporea]|uniref:Transglutaminase superfamily protein n=1 Tax=Saccharothrix variisporea TaxID=543527 RepID=A0A495X7U0_9PSEU|nr:hypothetical protein [Saccharothrix variisporea]RKT70240.1 hypothetical protein DFJ66_3496 [Saccharothrix variisporea]